MEWTKKIKQNRALCVLRYAARVSRTRLLQQCGAGGHATLKVFHYRVQAPRLRIVAQNLHPNSDFTPIVVGAAQQTGQWRSCVYVEKQKKSTTKPKDPAGVCRHSRKVTLEPWEQGLE